MSNDDVNAATDAAAATSHTLPRGPVGLEDRANLDFPVVGLGASAGGIEALTDVFRGAPSDSGFAFVVIQHLPPESRSLMAEILGRCTQMPVVQITDGVRVEPNCVYVIRPGYTVTLSKGELRLGEPVERRGHRRPVDDFFRSLALEQKEKAIIVVLSGTGTNGSAGAQPVKAAGGLCVAQDPQTAEFPGMPSSLIHTGYADRVLPPRAIIEFLRTYVRNPVIQDTKSEDENATEAGPQHRRQTLAEIHALLRTRTGHDFRGYRKPTFVRRLQRRMGIAGLTDVAEYVRMLREDPDEIRSLANDLMINVTGFFRDPEAWEALREGAIRPLIEAHSTGKPLRAWVGACSSGEEAYSLAILFAEEMACAGKPLDVKLFATDAAEKSLSLARAGIYPAGIEGDIAQERLERFFDKDEHTYRIRKEIRDMVVFAPQDLLRDPPFSRVDICTCRNLLIYLEPATQHRVLSLLSFAVRDGGYLFLGNTESLGEAERSFETVSKRFRIFRRVGSSQHQFVDVQYPPRLSLQEALESRPIGAPTIRPPLLSYERALLDEFAPTTVIVDPQERMLYVHGDTTSFLAYPQGELTTSIVEAARPALRTAVRNAFRQASETHLPAVVECQLDSDDATLWVRVTAAPLKRLSANRNLRLSFELRPQAGLNVPAASPPDHPHAEAHISIINPLESGLENEIRILRGELQASIEAYEASTEELKASHEEVLSVNEELQSANEELETSKEELQSLNEELTTVNSQLQAKILELEHSTNDLDNLLSSTNIAVVFLDTELTVRRYTPAVQDLIDLIPGDIGRSISNLAPKFFGPDGAPPGHGTLRKTAQGVLDTLIPAESEVNSTSGRWYLQRVLPYRTSDNHIGGVVITFVDITARKTAEGSLIQMQRRLQASLEQMPAAVIIAEAPGGRIMHANRRAASLFGQPYPPPFLDMDWHAALVNFQALYPDGRRYEAADWPLARTFGTGEVIVDEEIEFISLDQRRCTLSMSSAPVRDENDHIMAVVAAFWDISNLKMAERALRESENRLRLIVESAKDFAIVTIDTNGHITSWSAGAEQMLGWSEKAIVGRPAALIFTAADREAGVPEREMRAALSQGRAIDERWHVRQDGTPFWASGVLTVARDEHGNVKGFVKVLRDNTEQRQTEDRLYAATVVAREAQAQAETANRSKDDFISMISHELRTPLNTMRLWVRLIGHESLSDKDRLEGQQTLERAILAQQQLIDDLLDVSRISSGKLRIEPRPILLTQYVQTALDTVEPIAKRKEVSLSFVASPDVGVVKADPDRLQQVVWNLLSNAVKFTPSGGRVDVELRREHDAVCITFSDTGIGIRPELLPRIFERFSQGESGATRRHGGLGLGLAIARQLVELHGGTITASSEGEGRGSVFKVRLPLRREYIDVDTSTREPVSSRSGLAGLHILLVEDEASSREGTTNLLEAHGANVQACESARAARDAYELRRPNIIISDIGLPEEDGYAFLRHIRQRETERGLTRVPSLTLTAFAQKEDQERAVAAGYDAHMTKPVDPDRFLEKIRELVGGRRH